MWYVVVSVIGEMWRGREFVVSIVLLSTFPTR